MNKKAFYLSLVYSLLIIVFKLYILLGGYTLTKFGFYYSNIVGIFFILPFLFAAVYWVREKDYNGLIGGREGIRVALTVLALSTIFISVYNYIEFAWRFKDIAIQYYNSNEYLGILQKQQSLYPDKLKTEDFPKIISEQIAQLSPLKATTGKLIPMMIFGLSGSFVAALTLKKKAKA